MKHRKDLSDGHDEPSANAAPKAPDAKSAASKAETEGLADAKRTDVEAEVVADGPDQRGFTEYAEQSADAALETLGEELINASDHIREATDADAAVKQRLEEESVADEAAEKVAQHSLKAGLEHAGEYFKESLVDAGHYTAMAWDQDKEDAKNLYHRQVRDIKHAAHDIAHPTDLGRDIEKEAIKEARKVEAVAEDVRHPSRIVQGVEKHWHHFEKELKDTEAFIEDETSSPLDKKKLPIAMKIFAVLAIVGSAFAVAAIVQEVIALVRAYHDGITSEIAVTYILLGDFVLIALTTVFLGTRLLVNKRRWAALTLNVTYVLLAIGVVGSIMLYGITLRLIIYGALFVVSIVLQAYLDPSLFEERQLKRRLRDMDTRDRAEAGTLGLDPTGKGYITLNFFNLFWIFVVCSILGLIIETIFHMVVVDPGHYQDRAGMLFGPFSPIYGFGALLMTIFLNRFHKANIIIIFLVSAVIGGAFEYFVWLFMKFAYGATAWNYTGMWLCIGGGGTCGLFMAMWGVLGVVWIKLLLPLMLRIVNLIPWNWRYWITAVCFVLMVADGIMTLQSLDCWYQRLSGVPVTTPVEKFYAEHFDNAYMANRFQSMEITPKESIRGQDGRPSS